MVLAHASFILHKQEMNIVNLCMKLICFIVILPDNVLYREYIYICLIQNIATLNKLTKVTVLFVDV